MKSLITSIKSFFGIIFSESRTVNLHLDKTRGSRLKVKSNKLSTKLLKCITKRVPINIHQHSYAILLMKVITTINLHLFQ